MIDPVRILSPPDPPKPLQSNPSSSQRKTPINTLKYTHDGSYLMSGGADRCPRLWNPNNGLLLKSYQGGHGWEVLSITISKDKGRFCSSDASPNSTQPIVLFWDITTGNVIRRLSSGQGRVNCVEFLAEDSVLLTGCYDSCIRFWDLKTSNRMPLQTLNDAKDSITSISSHNYEIIAASVDGHVRIYDIRTGDLLVDAIGHPVTNVTFSQDGQTYLTSTVDNHVRLFDKSSADLLNSYTGHVHDTYNVKSCFANHDANVISGSEDGQVFVWDLLDSGPPIKTFSHIIPFDIKKLSKKDESVTAVTAWQRQVVSGGQDGLIKVWEI